MSVGATITALTAIAEAVKNHLAEQEAAAAAKQAGATGGGTGSGGVINSLTVEVHPVESLNYAMLHNNRSVFEQCTIKNLTPGAGSIRIVVDLFQGELSVPYKGIIPFTGLNHTVKLNDDAGPSAIRLPLASSLMRSLKEPLRTTMLVQITDTAETVKFLYEQTFPVTLLPVDQWRDTDRDRQWLPSFVQQRDPVIVQIIQRAQKYLMAIQDDAGAGFDGYQSVDPEDKDGSLALDVQVQAIWAPCNTTTSCITSIRPPLIARTRSACACPPRSSLASAARASIWLFCWRAVSKPSIFTPLCSFSRIMLSPDTGDPRRSTSNSSMTPSHKRAPNGRPGAGISKKTNFFSSSVRPWLKAT